MLLVSIIPDISNLLSMKNINVNNWMTMMMMMIIINMSKSG